jgi:hypothetical protein
MLSNNYYDSPVSDEDFIQIAIDVYGSGVRDNSREELIEIGREYHLYEGDE